MKFAVGTFACFSIAIACGCGGGGTEPTVPVTGTVSFNSSPVAGATVVFGADSGQARSATAVTDSSGAFSLSTYGEYDGAIVGTYKVAISKTETSGGMSEDEEHAAIEAGQELPEAQAKSVLPSKYSSAATSGLVAEVTASGENQFTFELKD